MSSSPPPYETENRPALVGLGASEQDVTIPSNNTKGGGSAVKDNKQVDAVLGNKIIHVTRSNANISCLIICAIAIIISTCLYFYRFSPSLLRLPPVGQINGGHITHDLKPLEIFVSNGAINGSIIQDPKRQVSPQTRERVLTQIKHWIDHPVILQCILWLHGPPGVGKSAIAQAIIDSYTTEKVAANFFFSRYDPDRNDCNRLFPTLAWQFRSIPGMKEHIARSLIEQPDLPSKDPEIQLRELIVRPFEALSDRAYQFLPDKVVVIDGIDGCVGTDLQERILKLIWDVAMGDPRKSLRFIISSRPENHINKSINIHPYHTLSIDLAERDEAERNIEKYFKENFERIAKDQGIDPATWPNTEMMRDLLSKASGQYLYASTVIKFVGEEDHLAKTRLDMILGLKPHNATQAFFAELDSLYIGILEQVPDQEFLKTFLALLVARRSRSRLSSRLTFGPWQDHPSFEPLYSYPHLRDSYGILMDFSEQELRIKLSRMRSLLKITPDDISPENATLYQGSFLDFLQDPSRSGQYHINLENATRLYLMLTIDSVVRAANESLRMIEKPDYYPPIPKAVTYFERISLNNEHILSSEDLHKSLRRLEKIQDQFLNLPNFTIPHNKMNTIFHVVHCIQLTISYCRPPSSDYYGDSMPLALMQNQHVNSSSSLLKDMVYLMNTLRHVDPDMIAMRARSWSEAQNLMDLAYHIVNGKHFETTLFSADVAQKATQLGVILYIRVPLFPRYVLDWYNTRNRDFYSPPFSLEGTRVLLIANFLDHAYILPLSRGFKGDATGVGIDLIVDDNEMPIWRWRTSTDPSSNEILFVMLKLARAIQYLDSMGIMLSHRFRLDDIRVDSKFCVRISPRALVWPMYSPFLQEADERYYENSTEKFGEFFCTIYFDTSISCTTGTGIKTYKPESGVDARVLQLIERCLSAEGKPSIDEVVEEMESWKVTYSYQRYLGVV